MGLVVNGRVEEVPGLRTISWYDDPRVRLAGDDRRGPRGASGRRWVRSIFLHCSEGELPVKVLPGAGAPGLARAIIEGQARRSDIHAGQHVVIDQDGTWVCCADLVAEVAYHAQSCNEVSIGIELAQTGAMELRDAQLGSLQIGLAWLTRRLGIPRQYHWPYLGEDRPVARLAAGGDDCCGIFGHRDQTTERNGGDPPDVVYRVLEAMGCEPFRFDLGEDLQVWRRRQEKLVALGAEVEVDGCAGPGTAAALEKFMGKPGGMWVPLEGDACSP